MNDYGILKCQGTEDGITYKIFLDSDFKYTITVSKGSIENIKHHQGVISVFGEDILDINVVNEILNEMIEEIKENKICKK